MLEITLEVLINYLGEPTKVQNNQTYWQCPYCRASGGDNHRDNLIYSNKKNIIKCFVNDSHSRNLLKDIFSNTNRNQINYYRNPRVNPKCANPIITEEKAQENLLYMLNANYALLNNEKALDYIKTKRGINKETIEHCGIGLDTSRLRWVFPTFEFGNNETSKIVGFEYRPEDLSKDGLYREKGSLTCMANINSYTSYKSFLVVVEGYLDAYVFLQHLKEQEQLENYHIVTPSNGVANIVNLMKGIEHCFYKYKKIYAYLDSDEVGISKMQELKALYPFIEIIIMNCGCKDFNEHYLRCIKKR